MSTQIQEKVVETKTVSPLEYEEALKTYRDLVLRGNTHIMGNAPGQPELFIRFRPDHELAIEILENGLQRWTGISGSLFIVVTVILYDPTGKILINDARRRVVFQYRESSTEYGHGLDAGIAVLETENISTTSS